MNIPKIFRCPRCKTGQLAMGETKLWCLRCELPAYEFGDNGSITQVGYVEPSELNQVTREPVIQPLVKASKPVKSKTQQELAIN